MKWRTTESEPLSLVEDIYKSVRKYKIQLKRIDRLKNFEEKKQKDYIDDDRARM